MKTTRKLAFNDVFRFAKIINRTGTKDELIKLMQEGSAKGADTESLGMRFFSLMLEKLPLAEQEIYGFLGGLCEKTVEEIANSELTEILELFSDIFDKNKDLKGFFISVLRSPTAALSTKS